MKNLFRLVLLAVAASLITNFAIANESKEDKVLNRWLGTWKSDVDIKPSKWFPKEVKKAETCEVKWLADNQMHMQLVRNTGNNEENILLQRYNPQKKLYEMWFFNYNSSAYYVGAWKERSSSMVWQFVDFNVGIAGKIVDHFTKDGKWQQMVLLRDKEGDRLLYVMVERTRVKQ